MNAGIAVSWMIGVDVGGVGRVGGDVLGDGPDLRVHLGGPPAGVGGGERPVELRLLEDGDAGQRGVRERREGDERGDVGRPGRGDGEGVLEADGAVDVVGELDPGQQLGLGGGDVDPLAVVGDGGRRPGQADREPSDGVVGVVALVDVVGDLGPLVDDLGGVVEPGRDLGDLQDDRGVGVDGEPRLGVDDVEVRVDERRRRPGRVTGVDRRVVLQHVVPAAGLGQIDRLLADHQVAAQQVDVRLGHLLFGRLRAVVACSHRTTLHRRTSSNVHACTPGWRLTSR